MTRQTDIEICVPSQPRYLGVVRATVQTTLGNIGFDQASCGQMMLAIDEALANIMRHGYRGRNDGPIWLRLRPGGEGDRAGVRIEIEDEAEQVDPEEICGRNLGEAAPGGHGVNIIRQVMDEVCYSRRRGGGMRLVMLKGAGATLEEKSSTR